MSNNTQLSRIDIIGSNGGEGLHYLKVCNMCKQEKPLGDFHLMKKSKDGHQSHCKICATNYKQKHPGYLNHKKNHTKDYRKGLIRAAKHRAKIKGVPFNITWKDLNLIWTCPVLNIPIFSDSLNNQNAPSIDRLIPEKGYTKGNVRIISRRANTLKGDSTINEMELILKYMKENIYD